MGAAHHNRDHHVSLQGHLCKEAENAHEQAKKLKGNPWNYRKLIGRGAIEPPPPASPHLVCVCLPVLRQQNYNCTACHRAAAMRA